MDDMKGKSVGVNRGSPQETALVKAAIPGLKIVRYEDDATVVQALISKQIDAAAIPGEVAKAVAKQPNGAGLGIQFTFFHQPNRMAVRLGDTAMRDRLNKAIQKMTASGELNAISEKWTGNPLPDLSHD
jgi:polar amino acid transport system substrate-binding protein